MSHPRTSPPAEAAEAPDRRDETASGVGAAEGLAKAKGGCEEDAPPRVALEAALRPSEAMPSGSSEVRGYPFAGGPVDWDALLSSFRHTGFQASCLGQAVDLVNKMVSS